eukprot:TRINITY_DN14105_c0_g1_i1.p1 TRINITY_DN14105_c0_g1~~TRINITY_DN14105_c0_g1_i1.p1  ORF type:complete len:1579 (-),score=360.24 TRINITY_DN14105_c0_g1_i1:36-4748(-)
MKAKVKAGCLQACPCLIPSGYSALDGDEALDPFFDDLKKERYERSGFLDEFLGVSHYWTEKYMWVIFWLQEFAIFWGWPAFKWPHWFYIRIRHVRWMAWDLYSHYEDHSGYFSWLQNGNLNKLFNLAIPSAFFLLWVGVSKLPISRYYTKNWERMLLPVVQILYIPFILNVYKYGFCNGGGYVPLFECSPRFPSSLVVLAASLPMAIGFPLLLYHRIRSSLVHTRSLRHEAYVKSRETEYLFRLNMTYRNKRLWICSSYRRRFVYLPVFQVVRSLCLVLTLCAFSVYHPETVEAAGGSSFVPSVNWYQASAGIVLLLFCIPTLWFAVRRVHRVFTSDVVLVLLSFCHLLNVIFGLLRASNADAVFLVDSTLENVMTVTNLGVPAVVLGLALFWYFTDHQCACRNGRDEDPELELLMVAAIPHKGGERACFRRRLMADLKKRQEALALRRARADTIPEIIGPDQTPEQQWRAWMQDVMETYQENAEDEGLDEEQRLDFAEKATAVMDALGQYQQCSRELKDLEATAHDPELADDRRQAAEQRIEELKKAIEDLMNEFSDGVPKDLQQQAAASAPPAPNNDADNEELPDADTEGEGAAGVPKSRLDRMLEDQASIGSRGDRRSVHSAKYSAGRLSVLSGAQARAAAVAQEEEEEFCKTLDDLHYDGSWYDAGEEPVDDTTRAYLRPYFEIFPSREGARFIWPVHRALLEEIIRENKYNHYIDAIRNAKRCLDYCSKLHATPELVSLEGLLSHISRLNRALKVCKRRRVTHHAHAMHPLQFTMETLLDELVFEFKRNKEFSLCTGRHKKLLPKISAFLFRRMRKRETEFLFMSPVMRRVLLKLLALRMFNELILEKRIYLRSAAARRRAIMAEQEVEKQERQELEEWEAEEDAQEREEDEEDLALHDRRFDDGYEASYSDDEYSDDDDYARPRRGGPNKKQGGARRYDDESSEESSSSSPSSSLPSSSSPSRSPTPLGLRLPSPVIPFATSDGEDEVQLGASSGSDGEERLQRWERELEEEKQRIKEEMAFGSTASASASALVSPFRSLPGHAVLLSPAAIAKPQDTQFSPAPQPTRAAAAAPVAAMKPVVPVTPAPQPIREQPSLGKILVPQRPAPAPPIAEPPPPAPVAPMDDDDDDEEVEETPEQRELKRKEAEKMEKMKRIAEERRKVDTEKAALRQQLEADRLKEAEKLRKKTETEAMKKKKEEDDRQERLRQERERKEQEKQEQERLEAEREQHRARQRRMEEERVRKEAEEQKKREDAAHAAEKEAERQQQEREAAVKRARDEAERLKQERQGRGWGSIAPPASAAGADPEDEQEDEAGGQRGRRGRRGRGARNRQDADGEEMQAIDTGDGAAVLVSDEVEDVEVDVAVPVPSGRRPRQRQGQQRGGRQGQQDNLQQQREAVGIRGGGSDSEIPEIPTESPPSTAIPVVPAAPVAGAPAAAPTVEEPTDGTQSEANKPRRQKKAKAADGAAPSIDLAEATARYQSMELAELKAEKTRLLKELNAWKEQFAAETGRQPGTSDIEQSTVSSVYHQYRLASSTLKARVAARAQQAAQAGPAEDPPEAQD